MGALRDTTVHVHSDTGTLSVTLAPHCDALAGSVDFIYPECAVYTYLSLAELALQPAERGSTIHVHCNSDTAVHAYVCEIDGHQMTDKTDMVTDISFNKYMHVHVHVYCISSITFKVTSLPR